MLLHITAGNAPKECELAVGRLLEVLYKELDLEVLAKTEGRFVGCLKSVLVRTDNRNNLPIGTIMWVCRSPYRPKHGRKNWFVTVSKIDEPNGCYYEASNGGGVIFQTFFSGDEGGKDTDKTQNAAFANGIATKIANTAEGGTQTGGGRIPTAEGSTQTGGGGVPAVRAIHIATGLTATASENCSRHQNKKIALQRLNELLQAKNDEDSLNPHEWLLPNNSNTPKSDPKKSDPIRIYEGIGFRRIDTPTS